MIKPDGPWLKQWMHYMFYAGVEHIYLCDHYEFEHEKLDTPLKQYIQLGLVTYLPWGKIRDAMQVRMISIGNQIKSLKGTHTVYQNLLNYLDNALKLEKKTVQVSKLVMWSSVF